jgi:hypothetical protein
MTTKNEETYSTKYKAVKAREYNLDPEKYAKCKSRVAIINFERYNSLDEERKNEFRRQRTINNQRYYLNRKNRLEMEAKNNISV